MDMHYIKVWLDWREATRSLKDAEKGRLIDAIVAYTNGEDADELLTGNERFVFPIFQLQIDRDRAKLERTCEARAAAGRMGGLAKLANASKDKQTVANGSKSSKDNKTIRQKTKDNKTEDDNIGASPQRTRAFVPPTADEVAAFCTEHGYNIDPGAFVDYYARQGWRLANGRKIVDWKACVRTWVRKDAERGPRTSQGTGNVFAEIAMELEGEQR